MITITDVAREADVSIATVSRVLNNSLQVMPETREKVQNAIDKLGYELSPKKKAAALCSPRVILVITNTTIVSINNNVAKAAAAMGYQVIYNIYHPDDEAHILTCLEQTTLCGIIFCCAYPPSQKLLHAMSQYPIVELSCEILTQKNICRIISDEEGMVYDGVSHLIHTGCQNIGMISTAASIPQNIAKKRQNGYIKALMEIENKPHIVCGDYTCDGGYHAARELLSTFPQCDAILCICDMMAIGCLNYLHSQKIKIPQDISVVGLDNMEISEYTIPPLTTIDTGGYESAAEAVKLLHGMIEKEYTRGRTVYIEHQLVIRKSTRSV